MILNYEFYNNGRPILVMIHGLTSSLETFIPLRPLLESQFSLLLVDQRGHGGSPPLGEDYTAEAMARDLKELLDHLKIKKIMLLGHSMGARTSLMFGKLYPEMVEKLVLEDMGIHQRQMRSDERDIEKMKTAKDVTLSSLVFDKKEDIYKVISPLFSYAKNLMETKVVEENGKYRLTFWPHVSVMYGYQGNFTDLTCTLEETDFPVLFINADQTMGSALTPSCIEHIKNHIPRAFMIEIKGAGHNVHKTSPQEFALVLTNFLVGS